MAREKYLSEFGASNFLKISWGLVMTIFLLFFIFNAFILNDSDVSTLDAVLFLSYGMLEVYVVETIKRKNPSINKLTPVKIPITAFGKGLTTPRKK